MEIAVTGANAFTTTTLQWGHVSIDVEMTALPDGSYELLGLQWGHVSIDVEIGGQVVKPFVRATLLQWGHVSIDVEICTRRSFFAV